ncbi:MAG: hypothetical protein ACFBSC_04510, partial [Microcoleaceae cyanobacterium]
IFVAEPFPWLYALGLLGSSHPAYYLLIASLGMGLDLFPAPASITQWQKLALFLSTKLQIFQSQCQIWGQVQQESPELSKARLGLLVGYHALFRFILQHKLGIMAPLEL